MDFNVFKEQVNQRRLDSLHRISQVPISALIWGPDPSGTSKVAECRRALKMELSKFNVYACYSEELYDPNIDYSNLAQQMAQVEAFDIVFSIPDSPGSIAEIHDFAIIPGLSSKIITFLNSKWNSGYSNQTLINLKSNISCQVQLYDESELPLCIIDESIGIIKTLKESFYVLGRR